MRMAPMWKFDEAKGTVIKITTEYLVVKWNDINGEWHYTLEQAEALEVICK